MVWYSQALGNFISINKMKIFSKEKINFTSYIKLFLQQKIESDYLRPDNIGIITHRLKNKYAYYIQGGKRQLNYFCL